MLRDLWSARAFAPGLAVSATVSAWTEQGHGAPATAEARPLAEVLADLRGFPRPTAVKIGLCPATLADAGLTEALRALAKGAPIVVDPVLRASDGGDLGASVDSLWRLAAGACLLTPNRPEAAALAGVEPGDPALLGRLRARAARGPAILVKGGHGIAGEDPAEVVDVLVDGEATTRYRRPRRAGPDPRGTGCALATAIACGLAEGAPLRPAIAAAITWLDGARSRWIAGADGRPHLPFPPGLA